MPKGSELCPSKSILKGSYYRDQLEIWARGALTLSPVLQRAVLSFSSRLTTSLPALGSAVSCPKGLSSHPRPRAAGLLLCSAFLCVPREPMGGTSLLGRGL